MMLLVSAAAAPQLVEYSATRVEVEGDILIDGFLLALAIDGTQASSFAISSIDGSVEALERDRTLGGSDPLASEVSWNTLHEGPFEVGPGEAREFYEVFAWSGPGARATAQGGTVSFEASSGSAREPDYLPVASEINEVDVTGGQQLVEHDEGLVLRVDAPFNLTVWDWRGTAGTASGALELFSGYEDGSPDPTSPTTPIADGGRQIYFDVREGFLTVTLAAGELEGLFFRETSLSGTGSLVVENATVTGSASSTRIAQNGTIGAYMSPGTGGLLAVTVPEPAPASVPQDVLSPPPLAGPAGAAPEAVPVTTFNGLVLALGAALILAVLAVAWLWRGQRARTLMDAVGDAMEFQVYEAVVETAPRLFRSNRYAREAAMMYIAAVLQCHGAEAAEGARAALPAKARLAGASDAYVAACIAAQAGRVAEAQAKVSECLEADPSYAREVGINALLAHLGQGADWSQRESPEFA